jgi:hypothetical protein
VDLSEWEAIQSVWRVEGGAIAARGSSFVHRLGGIDCVTYDETAADRPKEGAIGLHARQATLESPGALPLRRVPDLPGR